MGVVIPFKPRKKNIPHYDENDFEDKYEAILCIEMMIEMLEKQIAEKKKKLNGLDKDAIQEIDNLKKQIALLEKGKIDAMRDLMLDKENE